MAETYRITGQVVDRRTRAGIAGLLVEAWDLDTKYHDMLGQTISGPGGQFAFEFEDAYFGDFAPDRLPDVFFRVFQGGTLLLDTRAMPLRNLRTRKVEGLVLEVTLPEAAPAKPDRLRMERGVQLVEFARQSDFKDVLGEATAKTGVVGGAILENLTSWIGKTELKPLRPSTVRTRAIVDQDPATAERHLAASGVRVNDVKAYEPGAPGMLRMAAGGVPVNLKSGDRVDLYQENGKVKYYKLVPAPSGKEVTPADVARLNAEVATLKDDAHEARGLRSDVADLKRAQEESRIELTGEVAEVKGRVAAIDQMHAELREVRQQSADKDVIIGKLQDEVGTLRTALERHQTTVSPERLARLELALGQLRPGGAVRPQGEEPDEPPPGPGRRRRRGGGK